MKTTLTHTAFIAALAWGLASANLARGDEQAPAAGNKTSKGTVITVDQKENSVRVRGMWGTRLFHAGDNCAVSLEDKPQGSLPELRPGQKVEVCYDNVDGVLVARRIIQHNNVFKGYIKAMDPDKRTITVESGLLNRNFAMAEKFSVIRNDATGSLDDLKIGHMINVIYEKKGGSPVASRIELKDSTFVGTVQAIDAGTKTVKARNLLNEKKFNLADGCKIVAGAKADGQLSDLRIGDRVAFSYENANGVLVAHRIGLETGSPGVQSARAAKINDRQQ
jgi:Cu/Ag efflux protein CusF